MDLLASIKESLINMDREGVVALTRKALDDGVKPEEILSEALNNLPPEHYFRRQAVGDSKLCCHSLLSPGSMCILTH